MTMIVVENDAVIVNNADPLGIGRCQVFIYGVHDITGVKIPFDNLPWAYSTQSTNALSVPNIFTPVKVKHRFSLGQHLISTFTDQDSLEWHSPSPFLKVATDRDPRKYLLYDPEKNQYYNTASQENKKITNEIEELLRLREEKISQIDSLTNDLNELQNTPLLQNLQKTGNDLENINSEISKNQSLLEKNKIEYSERIRSLIESGGLEKLDEIANWYEEKRTNSTSELEFAQLKDFDSLTSQEKYFVVRDYFEENDEQLNELKITQNTLQESISSGTSTSTKLTESLKATNEEKLEIQKQIQDDIYKISLEIQEINKKIDNLQNSSTSGQKALTSFEELRTLDARISRFDEKTGIVYNNEEQIIGNWTGYQFFVPGYALTPGPSIPERKKSSLISEKSYLQAVDNNISEISSVKHASESEAIERSNNDKVHSCDISYETRLAILKKRQSVMQAVKWLRDKIISLFSVESDSAISQWIKATIKHLTALLKSIQKFLQFVNNVILEIAKITAQIKQLITWILSLPINLLVLLQDCISHFFNSLGEAFSDSLNLGIPGTEGLSFAEVNELVTQAQSTFQTATETIQSTAIVYTEIKAIEETFEKV